MKRALRYNKECTIYIGYLVLVLHIYLPLLPTSSHNLIQVLPKNGSYFVQCAVGYYYSEMLRYLPAQHIFAKSVQNKC